MEQIIHSYGRFFISCVVLAALLYLCFGDSEGARWSVRKEAAGHFTPVEETTDDKDFEMLNVEGSYAAPKIVWKYAGALDTETYELSELAEASDYEGRSLVVKVEEVTGGAEDGALLEEGNRLHFFRRGIYTLRLTAVDAERRKTTCEVRLPVNGR